MKRGILMLVMLALVLSAGAQSHRNCATDEHLQTLISEDPSIVARMQQVEEQTRAILNRPDNQRAVDGVITIPVVVHVIWNQNKPQENISDAQIQSQLTVLNEDFRRLNADASSTLSQFVGVAADVEIEFCLATRDPEGNPTSGIQRRSSTRTSWGTGTAMKRYSQGGFDAWPMDSYLNMWVCEIGGGILGFATFPGGNAANDGVVIGPAYFGSRDLGTGFYLSSPFDLGRTATHEVGHWVNLRHIWGDGGCTVDDGVNDTPKSDGANYGCPLSTVSCSTLDMVQNYMDYTDDACMNIYTLGQKDRARALFEPGGARAAMLNSQGCQSATPTCYEPTGVTVTSVGDNSATVTWAAHPYASTYVVELLINGVWDDVAAVNTNSAVLNNLVSCTDYEVRIKANCPNLSPNQSVSSVEVPFSTTGPGCEPPTCDTPENLYAANITFFQATLGWDAVDAATSYRAQGRLRGGLGLVTRTKVVETNSFRTNSLFPFLTYEFRVQSICDGIGTSAYSEWFPFTLNNSGRDMGISDDVPVVKLFDTESILQAYPNPTNGVFKLNYFGEDLNNVKLVVSDITGKNLLEYRFDLIYSGTQEFDLTSLSRGLYLLSFQKDGVNLFTEKVMVAR